MHPDAAEPILYSGEDQMILLMKERVLSLNGQLSNI